MSLEEAIAVKLAWPTEFAAPGHELIRQMAEGIIVKKAAEVMMRELKNQHTLMTSGEL